MASARGEAEIELADGTSVTVLFTNLALAQAEDRLKRSIVSVANDLALGKCGIGDIIELLKCGMEASLRDAGSPKKVTTKDAYDVMDSVGFLACLSAVTISMSNCLTYTTAGAEGEE